MTKKKITSIYAYKHNGAFHKLSRGIELLQENKNYYVLLNKKGNQVIETNNYQWRTCEKAIMYFSKQHWFNIIVMYKKNRIVYYCNLATPPIEELDSLKYIDYELDVKYFYDTKDKIVLDIKEFEYNKKKFNYSEKLINKIEEELKVLEEWIKYETGPFSTEFIEKWKED